MRVSQNRGSPTDLRNYSELQGGIGVPVTDNVIVFEKLSGPECEPVEERRGFP